jgi:hypothetical protein
MRRIVTTLLLVTALTGPAQVLAREVVIKVTNLTNAIYFTPLLVAAHRPGVDLFEVGHPASRALQKVAEGGDTADLAKAAMKAGAVVFTDPAGGLLAPGKSATARLKIRNGHRRISLVGMLLPTNDGFVGMDAEPLPMGGSRRTYYLYGYDAGTEANDERITGGGMPGEPGIPGDPSGLGGVNGTGVADTNHNTTVHVHRGIVGDSDPLGGASDLDQGQHAWLNPVARVVVITRRAAH